MLYIVDFDCAVRLLEEKAVKPVVGSIHNSPIKDKRHSGMGSVTGSMDSDSCSVSIDSSASVTHSTGRERSGSKMINGSNAKLLSTSSSHSIASRTPSKGGGNSGRGSGRKNESIMESLAAQDDREVLADALYRRAQAKLLLEDQEGQNSNDNVLDALADAQKVYVLLFTIP